MVGGPSSHFQWDSPSVSRQILALTTQRPDMEWTLTTSRRTPPDFQGMLRASPVTVRLAPETPPGWLEHELGESGEAWVTPDSVSMVYEALSAGCRLGLFQLMPLSGSRVAKGLMTWISRNVTSSGSAPFLGLLPPLPPLQEADRCARIILDRWFP